MAGKNFSRVNSAMKDEDYEIEINKSGTSNSSSLEANAEISSPIEKLDAKIKKLSTIVSQQYARIKALESKNAEFASKGTSDTPSSKHAHNNFFLSKTATDCSIFWKNRAAILHKSESFYVQHQKSGIDCKHVRSGYVGTS